jgi:hypothetical protein
MLELLEGDVKISDTTPINCTCQHKRFSLYSLRGFASCIALLSSDNAIVTLRFCAPISTAQSSNRLNAGSKAFILTKARRLPSSDGALLADRHSSLPAKKVDQMFTKTLRYFQDRLWRLLPRSGHRRVRHMGRRRQGCSRIETHERPKGHWGDTIEPIYLTNFIILYI